MARTFRRFARLAALAAALALPTVAAAQSSPSPYTSATRYDIAGHVIGTISADPDGVGSGNPFLATRTWYDSRGNAIKVETGTLSTWQSESVAPSAWITAPSPGYVFTVYTTTETTYDLLDRKATVTVKGSDLVAVSLTQYSYDSVGRLECTAVRMNPAAYGSLPASACSLGPQGSYGPDRITKNVYDGIGQLVQVREAVGVTTANGFPETLEAADATYSYTPNGQKQYVIDANGNRAQLTYDGHDRQVSWIFPTTDRSGGFDDTTQATALNTAGDVAACTIDPISEVSGITGPSATRGSTDDCEKYWYDRNGNRAKLQKRDGSLLAYTYDNLDRMTVKSVPERAGLDPAYTRDVFYDYDLQGRQTKARFDTLGGEGVTLGYDGFGRKTSESQDMDFVSRTITSQYDRDNVRSLLTYPDGNSINYNADGLDRLYYAAVNSSSPLFYPARDAPGRTSALNRWRPSVGWEQYSTYQYDPASRLQTLGQNPNNATYDATTSFTYNPASQILSQARDNDAYAWNGQANLSRAYTANGLNQYTAAGSDAYCYDANGNLTADGLHVYLYDVENRLVEMHARGPSNSACATLSYAGTPEAALRYDPLGRLYEDKGYIGGVLSSGTRFLYDGDDLAAEYNFNAGDPPLRRYVHGSGAGDDPLVWFEGGTVGDNARRYLYADEHGSIVAVTDASGYVLNANTYDEYGIPGATNQGRFQYTGQAWLPELGMYYYKARIYSPLLGRFLQTDPIGYQDQVNLYAYVGDDPINGADPSGREAPCASNGGASCTDPKGISAEKVGNVILAVAIAIDLIDTPVSPGPDASIPGAAAKTLLRTAEEGAEAGAKKAASGEARQVGEMTKPPRGKGSVPRSERDPKRTFTPKERAAKRAEQGNRCATGCGTKIDESNSRGHHVDRWADGGRTNSDNHAEVCEHCHDELHSGE